MVLAKPFFTAFITLFIVAWPSYWATVNWVNSIVFIIISFFVIIVLFVVSGLSVRPLFVCLMQR